MRGTVGVSPRVVAEDIEVGGYLLPAGTMVALSNASANFDPASYDNPADFDITATREPHLTFGGGAHYCLGANLARAELQEAFKLLTQHMPTFVLDGEPTWRNPMGIFGPDTLPLRFVPRSTQAA